MNELRQPNIGVDEGKIKFENVDKFKTDFELIISRNSNFIVTEETLTGSKKARADLRNAAKESATWRSKVKAELLKPFDEISDIAFSYEKKAKKAADDIDGDVKVFDEAERQKRHKGLVNWMAERAIELNVNADIPINDKWLIKGNFNGTKPKKAFVEEHIEPLFEQLINVQKQRLADTMAIRNYSESKSFDPEGYIHSLDFKSLAEIMSDIDGDVVKRQKREEAATAVAEMEAEQEQQRHANETTVDDKLIDTRTGEVIAEVPQEQAHTAIPSPQLAVNNEQEQIFTRLLYVTGNIATLQAVATFMNANGIEFRGES